ncbi:hypothetical protein J5X98_01070 [Leptothermofonsia sichuanensis E412]|uniref:hypothetical protein n=1 Tax=Leptothermofonsia sichuanensis TaxID=2917832 RepID=UPI001CA67773|nr:hypothetical protein [Leptothermofonsia sichuanensis]QZZ21130.1 hypothetical protein J5X98_01070 [Leptothermofonsia sichuanensis E412]
MPESATPEQLNKVAPAMLRFLLSSGEKGYKDGISSITDDAGNPPNQDNNWLFNPDEDAYIGRFADQRSGQEPCV